MFIDGSWEWSSAVTTASEIAKEVNCKQDVVTAGMKVGDIILVGGARLNDTTATCDKIVLAGFGNAVCSTSTHVSVKNSPFFCICV